MRRSSSAPVVFLLSRLLRLPERDGLSSAVRLQDPRGKNIRLHDSDVNVVVAQTSRDSTLSFDSSGFNRTPWDTLFELISGTTIVQFSLSNLPQATSTSMVSTFSVLARRSESDSAPARRAEKTSARTSTKLAAERQVK
jgi:hypothetical protein